MTHPSQVKIEKETAVGLLLQNLIDQGYTIFLSDDEKKHFGADVFYPLYVSIDARALGHC